MCVWVSGTMYGMIQRIRSEELESWVIVQQDCVWLDLVYFLSLRNWSVTQRKECQGIRECGGSQPLLSLQPLLRESLPPSTVFLVIFMPAPKCPAIPITPMGVHNEELPSRVARKGNSKAGALMLRSSIDLWFLFLANSFWFLLIFQFPVTVYFLVSLGHRRGHSHINTLKVTRLFTLKFVKSPVDNLQPRETAMPAVAFLSTCSYVPLGI